LVETAEIKASAADAMIAVDMASGAMATMIGRPGHCHVSASRVMTMAGIMNAVTTKAATPMLPAGNASRVMTTAGMVNASRATITAADANRK
jgi:hypothetical protein